MIARLRGSIVDRAPDGSVVLDVQGVGYEVFVPLGALGQLPAEGPVTLTVHTHVRDDAIVLYGFPTSEDRQCFRTLLSISNVGPKLALAILSKLDARGLAAAIARQDRAALKGIPGVGKKTIERLLLELKDKLLFVPTADAPIAAPPRATAHSSELDQVSEMLIAMGFKPSQASQAIQGIEKPDGKPVEALLREALTQLS